MITKDSLNTIYKEMFQHARHQEWQRSTFTASFTAAIGVVLGFIGSDASNLENIPTSIGISLMGFLAGLSVVGFLLSFKWTFPIWFCTYLADFIANNAWNIPKSLLLRDPYKLKRVITAASIFSIYYSALASAFASSTYAWYFRNNPDLLHEPGLYLIFFGILTSMILISQYKTRKIINEIKIRVDETSPELEKISESIHNYDILISGQFSEDQIHVIYEKDDFESKRERPSSDEMDKKWDDICMKKGMNPKRNDRLFRVKFFQINEHTNKIEIHVGDTDYKANLITSDEEFVKEYGRYWTANHLSVGVILLTTDNKIILGKRSIVVAVAKSTITVVSGAVDCPTDLYDDDKNRVNVFNAIKREVEEEVKIKPDEFDELSCLGVINNEERYQINMPFFGKLKIDSKEVLNRTADMEFSKLVLLDNTEQSVSEQLDKGDVYSDIGFPTLKMYYTEYLRST